MRLRSHHRLFLTYLVLIGVVTLAMSLGAESLLRRNLMIDVESDLRRELALSRALYEELAGAPGDSIARLISGISGRRVTIVTSDGERVGESTAPQDRAREEPIGDYEARPEVQAALGGTEGRAVRYSSTLRAELLYMATPTARGDVLRLAVPLVDIDRAVGAVQRVILGVGTAGLLLALAFSFGFSLAVTRPLRRMGDVARAFAAGDLSRRIEVGRDNDLGELGTALNVLADQLQRRLGQLEGERAEMQALIDAMSEGVIALSPAGTLRRANPAARRMFSLSPQAEGISPEMISRRPDFLGLVGLALDGQAVSPLELTGGGVSLLATAHPLPDGGAVLVFLDISELRRLEGVRRDFVANASHELKTPLTAIRGYSETLLDPDLPPELARRFAETVRANADRLQRIVDDLLDLSRIEAGGWRADPSTVEIGSVAREVWAECESDGRGIELRVDTAAGGPTVWADAGAIRQILTNLFGNARRYTPEGGTVTLRTKPAARQSGARRRGGAADDPRREWTVVEVEDTGSGIPSAHLSRVFERFYRADPARSREEGGTGLGLAIVKHLVESHGGWIEAESQVGRGTIIRFVLPARKG